MDVHGPAESPPKYITPRWVQVWFLGRSRKRWKQKYQELKVDAKRLQNRVNDVTKSRAKWRDEAEQMRQRIRDLEAENATLQEQAAALKKDGLHGGSRPAGR
jgi:SMC interacting uncharacterized protein involved in chromosome segregation